MNKKTILSIVLLIIFSSTIYSQTKSTRRTEKTNNERTISKNSVKKATKTLKVMNDNQKSIDVANPEILSVSNQDIPMEIVHVETAIPAFIGYTEKGSNSPAKISSMQDYKTKFGGASNEDIGEFQINSDGTIIAPNIPSTPKYMMYYMLELFFANGGGDCLITSVGHYDNSIR
ncbi:hypothetical protein [Gelidibacter mesophilus]|uniref:hypothetical protein n=1 Tax=Gelidibacter mesophilus TaxID=169050 RepID=UPI000483CE02|nr:hypothetical protein [Gelidibacter mesophilus]